MKVVYIYIDSPTKADALIKFRCCLLNLVLAFIAKLILISVMDPHFFNSVGVVRLLLISMLLFQSSKLAKYSGHETLATVGLMTFSLTFGLARLVYFPFW